jgi:hypothetical protein
VADVGQCLEIARRREVCRAVARSGCRAAVRDVLASVCGWFTEGVDTLDLKEAKGLPDELSA